MPVLDAPSRYVITFEKAETLAKEIMMHEIHGRKISDVEHAAIEEWSVWESDIEGKAAVAAASELGSERVSIARVDGNAAR